MVPDAARTAIVVAQENLVAPAVIAAALAEGAANPGTFRKEKNTLAFEMVFSDPVESRYHCAVVNGKSGCCKNGYNCSNPCKTPGYVPCPGDNYCCRMSRSLHTGPTHLNQLLQRPDTNATVTPITTPSVVVTNELERSSMIVFHQKTSLPLLPGLRLPPPRTTVDLVRRLSGTFGFFFSCRSNDLFLSLYIPSCKTPATSLFVFILCFTRFEEKRKSNWTVT